MDGLQGCHDQTRTGFSGAFDADLPCIGMQLKTKADLKSVRKNEKRMARTSNETTTGVGISRSGKLAITNVRFKTYSRLNQILLIIIIIQEMHCFKNERNQKDI